VAEKPETYMNSAILNGNRKSTIPDAYHVVYYVKSTGSQQHFKLH